MSNEWRAVVAALSDPDRLELFARVAVGASKGRALSAPDLTAAERRRLAALQRAGLVAESPAGDLVAVPERFAELLAEPSRPPVTGPDRFLVAGRLETLPRRAQDKAEVRRFLAARAVPLRARLTEREITDRLAELTDDPVGLRRALVELGLIDRAPDGSAYWRTGATEFDAAPEVARPA